MVLPIALALAASACWGTADFAGGLFTRRYAGLVVLFVIQAGGLATAATFLLASGDAFPGAAPALMALGTGCFGLLGQGLLYRALATGAMSVVAPVTATGAVLPVALGLAGGDPLTVLAAGGAALAITGVVLASRRAQDDAPGPADRAAQRHALLLGLAAAVALGCFLAGYGRAVGASVAWTVLLARLPSVPVLGAVLWRRRARAGRRPAGGDLARLLALAQLDCLATALFATAVGEGALSAVAVVGSLYPVVTVALARVVLHERLAGARAVGVAAALTGVALISLGSG